MNSLKTTARGAGVRSSIIVRIAATKVSVRRDEMGNTHWSRTVYWSVIRSRTDWTSQSCNPKLNVHKFSTARLKSTNKWGIQYGHLWNVNETKKTSVRFTEENTTATRIKGWGLREEKVRGFVPVLCVDECNRHIRANSRGIEVCNERWVAARDLKHERPAERPFRVLRMVAPKFDWLWDA